MSENPDFGRKSNGFKRPRPEIMDQSPTGMRQVKRTAAMTVALAGAGAVGLYLVTRESNCRPNDPNLPPSCSSSRSGSSSGGASSYNSGTSSNQGTVSRGGFGHTGAGISGHAGG
jgi:hypothetical protein